MGLVHAHTKRFTVNEFTRLWELGAFGHERMELIEDDNQGPHEAGTGATGFVTPTQHSPVNALAPQRQPRCWCMGVDECKQALVVAQPQLG